VSRARRAWLGLLGVGVLALLAVAPAAAHGNTVRVDDDYGPYPLIVMTGPGATVGDLVFSVIVTSRRDGSLDTTPILGATVTTTFQLSNTQTVPVAYVLPPEPVLADSGYYEHIVTIPGDGQWAVTVDVSGPQGAARATFPVIKRTPPVSVEWITWALVLLPVLVVLVVFGYLWRAQRRAAPPELLLAEEEDDDLD
jgi:hypothetical protein